MSFTDCIRFMVFATMRIFTMVRIIGRYAVPEENTDAHRFFSQCDEWMDYELAQIDVQRMIDEAFWRDDG